MWSYFFLLTSSALAVYATTQKTLGYWHQEPIVLICDDQVDINQVRSALKIWSDIGFPSHLRKDTEALACQGSYHGIITIKVQDDLPYSHAGETHTQHTWTTREVYSADISIRKGREQDLVLITHELGHAFGWGHSDKPNNIMFARIAVISKPDYSQSSRPKLEQAVYNEYLRHNKSEEEQGVKKWFKELISQARRSHFQTLYVK